MAQDREQRADARASVERILAAAPDVLAADPYASLQRVAEASGVHRATVYRHFASRERLISELYARWLRDVSGVFTTIDVAADDALGELRRVTREVYERNLVWKAFAWAPAYPPAFTPTRDRIRGQLAELLAHGRARGAFRDDMSVEQLGTAWGAPIQYLASLIVDGSRTLEEAVEFSLLLVRARG
jgi:AcrR family transcriptional regulator